MDPLSISASIIAVLQLTSSVISYLNDVKSASDARTRLRTELTNVLGILYALQDLSSRDHAAWNSTLQSLGIPGGPLEQFRQLLDLLAEKLAPVEGFDKLRKTLKWSFEKEDVRNILHALERYKTLFGLAMQNDHLKLSNAIKSDVEELSKDLLLLLQGVDELLVGKHDLEAQSKQKEEQEIAWTKDKEKRDLISWLSTLDFRPKQADVLSRRQEGSGRWLLDSAWFKAWLEGPVSTIWCPGIPGAGKTVLSAIIVDYVEKAFEPSNVSLGYIFFDYNEKQNQSTANLIGSLLAQLLRGHAELSAAIQPLLEMQQEEKPRPSAAKLLEHLRLEAQRAPKTIVIIDALDECDVANGARNDFLAALRSLRSLAHILVTSRFDASIEKALQFDSEVEIRADDDDVKLYINHRLASEPLLASHLGKSPTLSTEISNAVKFAAEGMFLLARLHMDALAMEDNPRSLRRAIKRLPMDLDVMYDQTMERILTQLPQRISRAKQVLSWLSCSFGPLTVPELQTALAVEDGDTYLDDDAVPDEDTLVSVCAGLVTIDDESNIIRLVHYTTREYLERHRSSHLPSAQFEIAKTCLTYLCFDDFNSGELPLRKEITGRVIINPLFEYAALHWGDHAREVLNSSLDQPILDFLNERPNMASAAQLVRPSHENGNGHCSEIDISPNGIMTLFNNILWLPAFFGLNSILEKLLARGTNINANSFLYGTALHAAIQHRHTLRLLIDRGADVHASCHELGSVLREACRQQSAEAVRLLLASGADANQDKNTFESPLYAAIEVENMEIFQLLLENSGDANMGFPEEYTLLEVVIKRCDEPFLTQICKYLLRHGANPNGTSDNNGFQLYTSPLKLAISREVNEIVEMLLQKGADIDARSRSGDTALDVAVLSRSIPMVLLLLDHGAQADASEMDPAIAQLPENERQQRIAELLIQERLDKEEQWERERLVMNSLNRGRLESERLYRERWRTERLEEERLEQEENSESD